MISARPTGRRREGKKAIIPIQLELAGHTCPTGKVAASHLIPNSSLRGGRRHRRCKRTAHRPVPLGCDRQLALPEWTWAAPPAHRTTQRRGGASIPGEGNGSRPSAGRAHSANYDLGAANVRVADRGGPSYSVAIPDGQRTRMCLGGLESG